MAITAACFDSARPALAGLCGASPVRLRGAVARRGAGLDWPLARGPGLEIDADRFESCQGLLSSACGRTADIPETGS